MPYKKLQIKHLSSKMTAFKKLQDVPVPPSGWVKAIRTSLGMSLQQLGNRLAISKQSVMDIEKREKEGSITLRALRETANAMDMQLVYGLIPKDGSLDNLIDRKASELARKVVMRTSTTMRLEDQENSKKRIEEAIKERTQEIKNKIPKTLWD